MAGHLLVVYGSWAGSSAEVAEEIGHALSDGDTMVDIMPAKQVKNVETYDAFVIGSAIHAGRLHPDIVSFVDQHKTLLLQKHVAYFVVCLTMKDDSEENRCKVEAYLDELRSTAPQINPVSTGLFAGSMIYKNIPFALKLIVKAMKVGEGDFRDWDVIRDWAKQLKGLLLDHKV